MNIEELRALVAANSAPYEVYTYEGGLYPEGTVWGIGIPGVWDVFIEQEEHGQYPQLQAMVTLANAVPALLARIDAYAALERAVAALAVVDGAIKHAAATLDIGALDGMAEREHAAVKTILARYAALRATADGEA